MIEAVSQACEAVAGRAAAFEVELNRVGSLKNATGTYPLVLTQSGGNSALGRLHQGLLMELAQSQHGILKRNDPKFMPHLTLLRDEQFVDEASIGPVAWLVDEIVLIDSEQGAGKHHTLGRWPLRD